MKERSLIKKKSQRSCWVKKDKTEAWSQNFSNSKVPESDWKGDFRVSMKSFYKSLIYRIAPIFAEETKLFEKPNVRQSSRDEDAIGKM